MTPPEVTAAQIGVMFQLAALTHDSPENRVEKARHAYNQAFALINERYPALSSAQTTDSDIAYPVYELCFNDSSLEDWHDLPVMGIWFSSEVDFTAEAIEELKTLCVDLLNQAAVKERIEFRYVGIKRFRELKIREWSDIEKAV